MSFKHVDIHQFNKVLIVYNRNSGKQIFASMFAKVNEVFKYLKQDLGAKVVDIEHIFRFSELDAIVEKAVSEKVDWVIIAGGDGTIRALIEKFQAAGHIPYFSVYSAGTVNLVAKELMMNSEPIKWFRRVSKGVEVPVYMGKANGRSFITVAGIGFDSLVVDNVTETTKKLLSKFAYVVEGGKQIRKEMLFNNWKYDFAVRFDDEDCVYKASSIIVGKSRYYAGRYNLFRGANLSEGKLHVALFTGNKQAQFARYATLIGLEAIGIDPTIIVKQAKKLYITANVGEFPVELDGDVVTETPLEIEIDGEPIKFIG